MAHRYRTLDFTTDFFETFLELAREDQRRFVKAMRLLDQDERHPSLRVHELTGDLADTWSASASDDLRLLFLRTPGGRKTLLRCTRHYR